MEGDSFSLYAVCLIGQEVRLARNLSIGVATLLRDEIMVTLGRAYRRKKEEDKLKAQHNDDTVPPGEAAPEVSPGV